MTHDRFTCLSVLIFCCSSRIFQFYLYIHLHFLFLQAVKVCLENARDIKGECEFYKESGLLFKSFLKEVLSIIEESLLPGMVFNSYFSCLSYTLSLITCCIFS